MSQDVKMPQPTTLVFKNKLGEVVGRVELGASAVQPEVKTMDIHDAFSLNLLDVEGKELAGIYFK